MKRFVLLAVFALFFAMPALHAEKIIIKMASIAPENSPWGSAVSKLAEDWSKISGGLIEIKVYHNGIAGGESDVIRKMRFNQIQAGVFTSFGLTEIVPEVLSLSIPALIKNEGELDYVLSKIKPELEKKMNQKKFKMIAWSRVGWIRFFSKKPVVFPADLKSQKVAGNPDQQSLIQAFKEMGYQQVPVAIPDVLSSLNSGLIEAMYSSPIAVGGFQWFGLAKYMCDLKISPFVGGIIISEAAWDKIPESMKPALLKSVKKIESDLDRNVRSMEDDAIATMKTYGLIVTHVTPEAEVVWNKEFEEANQKILGKTFSREMYNEITGYLKEYHNKK
jgi:TRAP-type C4-dicarboxylate transport system substrate-binding protein